MCVKAEPRDPPPHPPEAVSVDGPTGADFLSETSDEAKVKAPPGPIQGGRVELIDELKARLGR